MRVDIGTSIFEASSISLVGKKKDDKVVKFIGLLIEDIKGYEQVYTVDYRTAITNFGDAQNGKLVVIPTKGVKAITRGEAGMHEIGIGKITLDELIAFSNDSTAVRLSGSY